MASYFNMGSASGAASGAAAGSWLGPAGAIGGGLLGFAGGMMQNSSSAEEAKKQREFQAMMSSSAHQRESWDLKLAGLNPILTATGGPGAATPGAASASVPSNVGQAATTGSLAGASAQQTIENSKIARNQRKVSDIETNILTSGIGKTLALPISVFKKMGFGDKAALAMGAAYSAGDIKSGIDSLNPKELIDKLSGFLATARGVDANGKKWRTYDFNEVNRNSRNRSKAPKNVKKPLTPIPKPRRKEYLFK